MILSLFKRAVPPKGPDAFWTWFAANEARLFALQGASDPILGELDRELHRVHADLTYEIGPEHDGRRDFVISADGLKAAFPAVEAVHAAAPSLPRWQWVKFRPRRAFLHDLDIGGLAIKPDDVRYVLARDGARVGIVLFFAGYTEAEHRRYGQAGFLLLDEALGEYAIETEVGFIEFHGPDSPLFAQSHPLRGLPAHFDQARAMPATT
jgi:hypothetical protein